MWRGAVLRCAAAQRPYRRVLQLLQTDGEGLPAAAAVFDEFRTFFRQTTASNGTPAADVRPLQRFCGRADDAEPFALVMMKVLCDLQKLEEMRFLFAQCVLELPSPSVELFNVYLLAISLTDTFNQYEIENAVEAMRAKRVEPDVVTRLSLFIVYTRLGHDYTSWWESIHSDVRAALHESPASLPPLLGLRLQHCFQTLLRVHHDVAMVQECFELLRLVDPARVTTRLLLPYMLLSANNAATPPATPLRLIALMDAAATAVVTVATTATGAAAAPALNNELTALRLMAQCARRGDAASADALSASLNSSADRERIDKEGIDKEGIDKEGVERKGVERTEEADEALALLHLAALARGGDLRGALALLEERVPPPRCRPLPRPKLFLAARRATLLAADPISALAQRVARGAGIDEALAALDERHAAGGAVTHKSLDVLLDACVLRRDEARAAVVFASFDSFAARRTADSFLQVLRAAPDPVAAARRVPETLAAMEAAGVAATPGFLRGALEIALDAQDTAAALDVVDQHVQMRAAVESKHSIRLMRLLALVVDVGGVRRLVAALRATQSPVDPRGVSLCVATFHKWGVPCEDLTA